MTRRPFVRAAAALGLLLVAPVALAQQPGPAPLPPLPSPTAAGATGASPAPPLPPPQGPTGAPAPTSAPPPASAPAPSDGVGGAGDEAVPLAAPPPAESQPVAPRVTGKEYRPSLKGSAGFQYAQAHGVPITGGRMRLGVGGQNDTSAFYAVLSMLYGSTAEGLRTWDVRGSISGDLLRTGILRLGIDVEMGYLVVRRVTVDSRMWALGLGAGVHASVDVYQFGPRDDHAIFLEGKLDAHLHFGSAFMWGPSVLAGIRY
ncbi:MAG: hypothetical protein KF795_04325 [Labilithrix sp.]|nr:hypothetical protein [Labilithrix sp.]